MSSEWLIASREAVMSCVRCFCSCIWGSPDPGPVRLRDVQQVVLDTNKMGDGAAISTSIRVLKGFAVSKLVCAQTSVGKTWPSYLPDYDQYG